MRDPIFRSILAGREAREAVVSGNIATSRRDLHRLGDLCPSKRKAAGMPVIRTGPPPGLGPIGPPAGLAAGPDRPARTGERSDR